MSRPESIQLAEEWLRERCSKLHPTPERVAALAALLDARFDAGVESRQEQVKELRRQVTMAEESNHQRNLELDALHYVWCDGGCHGGVHRWCRGEGPLTEEVVKAAECNTARMRTWLENWKYRARRLPIEEEP